MGRRIGILGGTFNPPHRGHVHLASEAVRAVSLDALIVIVAGDPPHKGDEGMAPAGHRLEMARRAFAGVPAATVSDLEVRRPGPSYSVDTLNALKAEHPSDTLLFIVGADAIEDLPSWRDLPGILAAADLVIASRPGYPLRDIEGTLAPHVGVERAERAARGALTFDALPISATEVRRRIARGEPWRDLVPEGVARYIDDHGLYGPAGRPGGTMDTARVEIRNLSAHDGAEVTVLGWLYNRRSSGKIQFLEVRDGSGIVQCVLASQAVPAEVFERAKGTAQESSVRVRGKVRADKRAPGGYEIDATDFAVIAPTTGEYPISLKEHGPDFLLSHRHLWLRHKTQHALLRVRDEVEKAIRDFFAEHGFVLVDAPIFTPAACEGTTTLFEVSYFDDKAYLTQSGQLYMEAAAMAFGKVYCFGPTFRAERSKTRRHLTEFWMVEPEMAFATLDDVMNLAEEFIAYIVKRVLTNRRDDLVTLGRDIARLEKVVPPFPRISYDEAVERLKAKGHPFEWGGDLGAPDETVLSEEFDRPLLVHRYPADVKAFYMKRDPENPKVALCVDVLAPEGYGEIIGGGQRADDLAYLESQIQAQGLPREAFEWYLDLRRYGSCPHGGFGLGIERTVAWICGREHIRECIPFPRMLYRIYP